ncbi:PIG-L deacetylase family protein [Thalassotalea euphylliae]|uniref:PIG-L family deacetylase n=1 Tax=Thalassotalea euphylliae TaxID=1655234 RepID=A0A3E0UFA9_9GAMM|nr:PIG-L deacetylase family protein [Thalassotalea euphylliae]REL34815.1 PIG-L family deacetylase [Thalassotalea euphylliae]
MTKLLANSSLEENTVLVVAAHADDEVLGCAGTIAKHTANGDKVEVIFLTDGVSSRVDKVDESVIVARRDAAAQSMKVLNVSAIHQADFPDNQLDTVPLLSVIHFIEPIIEQLKPQIVYTHFAHDLNIDHRICHQAVMTACRPQSGHGVKSIFSFEVLSSTEWNSPSLPSFTPQYINNISDYWPQKERALHCYQKEMRQFPHSRSFECIEALATLRGATHGFAKAEAFFVERILN